MQKNTVENKRLFYLSMYICCLICSFIINESVLNISPDQSRIFFVIILIPNVKCFKVSVGSDSFFPLLNI